MTTTRLLHVAALTGIVLFTLYGSWVPFEFQEMTVGLAWERFQGILLGGLVISSRSDFLANIVLAVPLGYFLGAVFLKGRSLFPAVGFLWTLAVCFSMGVEFSQLFTVSRCCAFPDIVAQSIGSLVGLVLWALIGHRLDRLIERVTSAPGFGGRWGFLLIGYWLLLFGMHALPMDFEVGLGRVYHRLVDGRNQSAIAVEWIPFREWYRAFVPNEKRSEVDQPEIVLRKFCSTFAYAFPLGCLASRLPWFTGFRALGLGIVTGICCEGVQVLVSRSPSVTDALTLALGTILGYFLLQRFR